jgi:hypothetical protein
MGLQQEIDRSSEAECGEKQKQDQVHRRLSNRLGRARNLPV